jgi:hypothetical protein
MSTTPWSPIASCDLATSSAKAFNDAVAKVNAEADRLRKAGELPPLTINSARMVITPMIAETMLLRNGGNRKVSLSAVHGMAAMMAAKDWVVAQPLVFDEHFMLFDGQHRLFALLFGGFTVEFSVLVVPARDQLFAYIDAGRSRSGSDTLYTAGADGHSSAIASATKLLVRYESGAIGIFKQPKARKLQNAEVLRYVHNHEAIIGTAHAVSSDHPHVVVMIDSKGVATAFAYLIGQHYDELTLQDFLSRLANGSKQPEDSAVHGLWKRLVRSGSVDEKLTDPHKFALLIKGFNMDVTDEKITRRGLYLRDNDAYPRVIDPNVAEAAE